jgi:L,D-transpeptidase ErfK/SrfK
MTTRHASLKLRLALIYAAALLLAFLFARGACAAATAPLGEHMYYRVVRGDDFYSVAQKFDIGIGELRSANPHVNEAKLKAGTMLVLPTAHLMPDIPHQGIVINLPERRLYYFDSPQGALSFPVTVGKEGWETPEGVTYIANKRVDPTWTVPDKIREEDPTLPAVVPPGPDNPLGKYAMDLGFPGIRIHGTNNPKSIGRQSSHGCIRMYPADIEKLFNLVPLKTKVTIINQPYKIGWKGNTLLLEVSPQADGAVARNVTLNEVKETLNQMPGRAYVDWDTIDMTIRRRDGMPVAIGRRAEGEPAVAQSAAPVPATTQSPSAMALSSDYYAPPARVAVETKADTTTDRWSREAAHVAAPASVTRYRTVTPPSYVIQGSDSDYGGYYTGYTMY